MSTSISGNVRLVYGNHTHNETFNATTTALNFTNTTHDYSAGADRAEYHATTGAAIATGPIDDSEGLLLIANTNTVGKLCVSVDAGSNWDVKIPAGLVNLISVGPDHAVHVKTDVQPQLNHSVSSVTTGGVINFVAAINVAGTYIMAANASPNHSSTGPSFIMKTTVNSTTVGQVFELDGKTPKDLKTGDIYTSSTHVNLNNVADYRFTITEA